MHILGLDKRLLYLSYPPARLCTPCFVVQLRPVHWSARQAVQKTHLGTPEMLLLKQTTSPKLTLYIAEACSSLRAAGLNIGLRCGPQTSLDLAYESCPYEPREPPRARRGRLAASATSG